ncbi:hypothetical protein [Lentzea terrae]|uniref:hypothetical protein n=1 Tax=Lentzea terrae TaxID=2200761 RepID=UPI001300A9F5|nr:hypothetical protein [Lentzea terrae]
MTKHEPDRRLPAQDKQPRGHSTRRGVVIAAAVVVTIIISTVTLLVMLRGDRNVTPGAQDPSPTGPAPTTTGQTTATSTITATTNRPSAVEDLAAFLSAAASLDKQLHDAAAAINAAGPPWAGIGPEVARLVTAADLAPAARAIPAGLPHDLQQSVILVYSDLASRRNAMNSFETTPPGPPHDSTKTLLRELGNGHAAAARFDADLAATRAIAAQTPPIAAVPKDSRLVAETLLRVQYVDIANRGCDSRGGVLFTELPEIRWGVVAWNPDGDGAIGRGDAAVDFTADLRPDGTWAVQIMAC